MKMTDILYYGDEAQSKLIAGINKVADAVKVTMGPGGRNVIIATPEGPVVTKDGYSVAKAMKLIDPIEHMGCQLIQQVSSETVDSAGDGTTTATVLAQAMMNDITVKNATEFRRGMEAAKDDVLEYLSDNKKECSAEELYQIALTSSNGDKVIAEVVSTIANAVGKAGIIEVAVTGFKETTSETEFGYRFERGVPNSNFINKEERGTLELNGGGYILCFNNKVDDYKDIVPIVSMCREEKKFLVIMAKEFDEKFIHFAHQNGKLGNAVIPILAPDFGNNMLKNLEDIAIYCDTSVMALGELRTNPDLQLGVLDSIKCTTESSSFTAEGAANRVAVRIKQLENLTKKANNVHDVDKLKKRIAQLSAGYGKILVGGATVAETKERFDRYEDAIGACMAALKEGILPGGGAALFHASEVIGFKEGLGHEYEEGFCNVLNALSAPLNQILFNADIKLKGGLDDEFKGGVDATNGTRIADMYECGIIDPFTVTTSALKNAVSIATMILTTGCVVDSNQINVNLDE